MKTPNENLPKFLYRNCEGLIAVGVHGDSVVEDEWNEWIAQQELTSQRWIPVGERLPEDSDAVLVYRRTRYVEGAYLAYRDVGYYGYIKSGEWCDDDEQVMDVTHWMPLPDKPNQD